MNFSLKKLYIALSLFVFSVLLGMIGFIFIEKMGLIDSFYMAIITIGSVGFTEVHELSQSGRLFTAFYIIFNLGIYAYTIAVLGQYLFQGELKNIFYKIKTEKKLRNMENHTIVCGLGRNGCKAVEELIKKGIAVVGVEKGTFDSIKLGTNNFTFFEGDATQDEILIKAGIKKASSLITTLPNDADNVFITLTARELNPDIKIVSRASALHSEKKLKRSGADHVVMPELIGGHHMANLVCKNPSPVLNYNNHDLNIAGYEIEEIPLKIILSNTQGVDNLNDLQFKMVNDKLILGYRTLTGELIFNQDRNVRMNDIEYVIVLNNFGKKV